MQKVSAWRFPHLFHEYGVCRAMRICIWYGGDAVMQGVSQYVGHSCKVVMESDDFQMEVELFPDSSLSMIFMVEVFGIRLPHGIHESGRVICLDHLVAMGGLERFHKSCGSCLVKSQSETVESAIVVFFVPEQDFVASGEAQVIRLFHNIYLFHKIFSSDLPLISLEMHEVQANI